MPMLLGRQDACATWQAGMPALLGRQGCLRYLAGKMPALLWELDPWTLGPFFSTALGEYSQEA